MRAVNLLPSDLQGAAPKASPRAGQEKAEGIGAYLVLGALALCVAALAAFIVTNNTVKQRQADLQTATERADVASAEAAALKPYADFQAMASARIATVRGLAAARFDWEQALRDLSRAMPGDVKLLSLNGDMGLPGATGTGGDPLRGSIQAPAITLTGCAPDQQGVARMMARVKSVDGRHPRRALEVREARRDRRHRRIALRQGRAPELLGRDLLRAVQGRRRARPRGRGQRARAERGERGRRDRRPAGRRADRGRPGRRRAARVRQRALRLDLDHHLDHDRGHAVNRTKVLIPAVVAVAAIAAFWFLVLAPKREEITKLDADVAAQEAKADQAEQLAATYRTAKDSYRENYTTIARLGKAVPADDDVRSLLVQIDATAKKSKVNFRSLSVERRRLGRSRGGEQHDGRARPRAGLGPGRAAPASRRCRSPSPSAAASSRLSDFFQRLEHFVTVQNEDIDVTGRLLLLGSIAITPDSGDLGKLEAQIGAASYLLPPTQGLTGGASPQAPAGATPESSSTDGTTPPTTSATITGVR